MHATSSDPPRSEFAFIRKTRGIYRFKGLWGKLTAEILAWAEQALAADPALRPAALAGPIEANFGVRAHPRSIERALARHRERHSKSR